MTITSFFKKTTALVAIFALVSALLFATKVGAVPYDPNHPGATTPTFNMYTGTPSVGDESDFLRGKEEGSTGYVNEVNSACNNNQKFTLRVYVHNGANQTLNENGTGPGVAKDTKVKVVLPTNATDNFALNSTISASNAASVNDGMTIDCNGKVMRLKYVAGTASQYTVPGGNQALSDSIVTTGAAIGTNAPNGDVWGCWDQRVWVTLTVQVEAIPEIPQDIQVCELATNKVITIREDQYNPSLHTRDLAKCVIPGNVVVCEIATKKVITIKEDQFDAAKHTKDLSKCQTPTTLVDTGTGSIIGMFAAVSAAGAIAHRVVLSRRFN